MFHEFCLSFFNKCLLYFGIFLSVFYGHWINFDELMQRIVSHFYCNSQIAYTVMLDCVTRSAAVLT